MVDAFGIRAHYSYEDSPLGRGGALRKGLDAVPGGAGAIIATNGDVISGASLVALFEAHVGHRRRNPAHLATILTAPMISPYGIVDVGEDGIVQQFREKAPLPYSINGGVYILEPSIYELLPALGDHETSTFPVLAEQGRMAAVQTRAFWRSVDSPKDLKEAGEYMFSQTRNSL